MSRLPLSVPSSCQVVETGMHGPFRADRLKSGDLVACDQDGFEAYLERIRVDERWNVRPNPEQWAAVLRLLLDPFSRGCRCHVLKYDESDSELFHEVGFVLGLLFRETLFICDGRDCIERFVIGND